MIRLSLTLGMELGVLRNRIRELREAKGVATQAMADLLGCSQSRVSRLETGAQPANEHDLTVIGRLLGVHPAELITDDMIAATEQQRELLALAASLSPDAAAALIATARALAKGQG
jgi:transcriptional regulator with XRE-family HTH domain